jgi:outer membrane lipoprotein SlyB
MDTTLQTKSPNVVMWIAGVAVILFSATGIAAIMGWIPTSMGHVNETIAVPAPAPAASHPAPSPHAARTRTAEAQPSSPVQVAERAPIRTHCADCGVIESTREVSSKGTGSGVGAVGGAVVGGLLGHQIGEGRGNMAATALGAVGGAVAGNEVEKRVKSTKAYEVTVRLDDGSTRVVNEGSTAAWHTGDRVRIVSGELQAQP